MYLFGCRYVVDGHVTVTVPSHYTALAGDLLVVFTTSDDTTLNDTDWHIDVIESRDQGHLSPLTTVDIPGGYSDGEVSIGCGVIDVAGQLTVRLVDSTSSDVVAQSNVVDVAWPTPVTLRLPHSHQALTDDLRLTLSVDGVSCQSQHSDVFYTLQLLYLGLNASSSFVQLPHTAVVFKQTLTSLSRGRSSAIIISCSLIDRAGSYQAVLTSSRRPDLPVAVSNVVVVGWSDAYSLSLSSLSKSCTRQLVVVRHTQPRCHHALYTLRVFVLRRLPSNDNNKSVERPLEDVSLSLSTSSDWRQVSVRRVKSSRSSVTLDCALFDSWRGARHCVLLLSTASDASEHVHRRYCTNPPPPAPAATQPRTSTAGLTHG